MLRQEGPPDRWHQIGADLEREYERLEQENCETPLQVGSVVLPKLDLSVVYF